MQGAHAKHRKLQLCFLSVRLLSLNCGLLSLNCVAGNYKGGKSCSQVFQVFVSSRVITELLDSELQSEMQNGEVATVNHRFVVPQFKIGLPDL